MVTIHEQVRVAVIHGPGADLRPVWFDWRARKHDIREITYRWRQSSGSDLILHFAVTDGAGLYELAYNVMKQTWLLETIHGDAS